MRVCVSLAMTVNDLSPSVLPLSFVSSGPRSLHQFLYFLSTTAGTLNNPTTQMVRYNAEESKAKKKLLNTDFRVDKICNRCMLFNPTTKRTETCYQLKYKSNIFTKTEVIVARRLKWTINHLKPLNNGKFKVKWANMWEWESSLNCLDLINEFNDKNPKPRISEAQK